MSGAAGSKPVIIGSGLSGMAISHFLTKAEIPHLLLGAAPNSTPRLGESIDPAGTLALLRFFPEYSEYYYKKRFVSGYLGDFAAAFNFDQHLQRIVALRLVGFPSPEQFIHVDRIGFDRALFRQVASSPFCETLDARVSAIQYDPSRDAIDELSLDTGKTVRPSYVFDATNHVRLVAKRLGIPVRFLCPQQRTIFRHYRLPPGAKLPEDCGRWLVECTSLLRLYERWDAIDGLAWCIPLGRYLSVGLSVDANLPLSDEEVQERVEAAYERRGLHFLARFSERSELVSLRNRYFIHERAYGKNWLLAGPSFGQVWFPSSSAVVTSILAGFIAPSMMRSPRRYGPRYERYFWGLLDSHALYDSIVNHDPSSLSVAYVQRVGNLLVADNSKRVCILCRTLSGPMDRAFARLFHAIASMGDIVKGESTVCRAPLGEQTERIFSGY